MAKPEPCKEHLFESLRDPEAADQYFTACLEDGDPEVFRLALRDMAESRGGVGQLARRPRLNRESLYRMLSKSGNSSLESLGASVDSLGLRLAVEAK
jgi:probable addiction module antidote protein